MKDIELYPAFLPSTTSLGATFSILEGHSDVIFELPGSGRKLPSCGEVKTFVRCPNFGKVMTQKVLSEGSHDSFVTRCRCHKPSCPVCFRAWADREGRRVVERLRAIHDLYRASGVKLGRFKHIVISPPQDWAISMLGSEEDFSKLRGRCIKLLKEAGFLGYILVFHPWRQNDPREANFNPTMPVGIWYLSPHFHALGCGFLVSSDKFFERSAGWVYKQVRDKSKRSIRGTVAYLLSHCGIRRNRHNLTYLGVFSYNKAVVESEVKEEISIECKLCGASLHEYVPDPGGNFTFDSDSDLGIYYRKVIKRRFRLKGFRGLSPIRSTSCHQANVPGGSFPAGIKRDSSGGDIPCPAGIPLIVD